MLQIGCREQNPSLYMLCIALLDPSWEGMRMKRYHYHFCDRVTSKILGMGLLEGVPQGQIWKMSR